MSDGERLLDSCTSAHLLHAAENGVLGAEDLLITRYRDRLLELVARRLPIDLASRFSPDDVVQSACRVFITRLRDGKLKSVEAPGELWHQFVLVTLNKIRSSTRKHRRDQRSVSSDVRIGEQVIVSREPDPEHVQMLIELVQEILACLSSERQKQVVLYRLQGMTTAQIAAETSFSEERVRQIIRWVRDRLQRPCPDHSARPIRP